MKREYGLTWLMGFILLLWGGLFFSSISSAVHTWYRLDTFNHCFLILPICIYVIQQNWQAVVGVERSSNWLLLLPLSLTMLIWVFGVLAQLLVVEQGAAFLMLPLMMWLVLGNKVAKVLWFPGLFWMFSVPFGEFLVPQLQELTANITVYLLQVTGVPVYREGLYLAVPNGLFEVAVACSGIRYLIASVTLGTLFAYLNFQSTKKRLIFVIFSFFLPLLANGIRAYGIVMIAYLSDMKHATGVDHLIYGWLFFGLVIFVMFAIGNIWRDPQVEFPANDPGNIPKSNVSQVVGAVASVCVLVLVASLYRTHAASIEAAAIPDFEKIFVMDEVQDKTWLPQFTNASASISGNSDGIDMHIAFYAENVQDRELINTTNLEYNKNVWTVVQQSQRENFALVQVVNSAGSTRFLAYSYFTPAVTTSRKLKVKLLQAISALGGQEQKGAFVAVSMLETRDGSAREQIANKMKTLVNAGYEGVFVNE